MLLLKGFFRQRTTIIYLILFSILLATIIILFSFLNYYSNLNNELFEKSSYILIVSNNDYDHVLSKNKNVLSFEKALLLSPDYAYNTLTKRDSNSIDTQRVNVNWEDFILNGLDSTEEKIFVFSESQLNDNEINLGISSDIFNHQNINDIKNKLIGKIIGLYNDKKNFQFVINDLYESDFFEMKISEKLFKELSNNSNLFVYRTITKNYDKAIILSNELEKFEKDTDHIIMINYDQKSERNGLDAVKLKWLINILSLVSYIVIFIFIIIFFVITSNIIRDEYQNIRIERLLGYNKKQIKNYLCLNLISLNILSVFIATIISIVIIFLIN